MDPNHPFSSYTELIEDFDAVLAHGVIVLESHEGQMPHTDSVAYGRDIFTTIIAGCKSLRRLLPEPLSDSSGEIWDLMSISAVARCIVDAHDSFRYVCGSSISAEQANLRINLCRLHGMKRKLIILKRMGSDKLRVAPIEQEIERLKEAVSLHPEFNKLCVQAQSEALNASGSRSPGHLTTDEKCNEFGLNKDFRDAAYVVLSQFVHSHPMAVEYMLDFQAGSKDSYAYLSQVLIYVMPFLCKAIEEFKNSVQHLTPCPCMSVRDLMDKWMKVYREGFLIANSGTRKVSRGRAIGFGCNQA